MKLFSTSKNAIFKEVCFQLILHLVVFSFYAIDRRNPQIEEFEIVYFLHLSIIALIINYFLLHQFLFQEKYIQFALTVLLTILSAMLIEELVLEHIYFPDTRGKRVQVVFSNLMNILPVITILVGFKFAWDAFGKQRELNRLQEVVKESELQFLKSQINPHFLFNNLNNLYSFAIENSPRTPEIILELSAVLRYMLYDCKAAYVPLSKEVEQLKNFIKISELQIEDRGKVNFIAKDGEQDYKIAPLLLMVFVENAFKHSNASQSKDIDIAVKLDLGENGQLEFYCTNTFEIQSNTDNLSSGIGLENVKKRLQLLYPNGHELSIKNDDGTYAVYLSLQLNQNN
ncbi:MAG: histidine kinase [Flavobacteriales bacterium]|nr:histidine kinase [Flavobacteriales bacterium]